MYVRTDTPTNRDASHLKTVCETDGSFHSTTLDSVYHLVDECLPGLLLPLPQHDEPGQHVARNHVQLTEKLGQQTRDLGEGALQYGDRDSYYDKNIRILIHSYHADTKFPFPHKSP